MRVCSSFQYVAENFGCPKRVVEVGLRTGTNARGILHGYKEVEEFVLVDRYKEYTDELAGLIRQEVHDQNLRQMIIAVLPWGDKLTFYPSDSVKAAEKNPNLHFDFIYLDDDHLYDGVMRSIVAWYPKLAVGGFMGGHDNDRDTVQRAVNDFVEELAKQGQKAEIIAIPKDFSPEHTRIPDWLIRKL